MDSYQEQQYYESKAKHENSVIARDLLEHEIGVLPESEITPETATLIGGLLVFRYMEEAYLWGQTSDPEIEELFNTRKHGQEMTASFKSLIDDARRGKFEATREFVGMQGQAYLDIAEQFCEQNTDTFNVYAETGRKITLVAEKIPDEGDGSLIKAPTPANTDNPEPLKVLIERFKAGGEIR